MKKNNLRIIALVISATLVISLFFIIWQQTDYRKSSSSREQAQQMAGVDDLKLESIPTEFDEESEMEEEDPPREPDANEAALLEMDRVALQQSNPDVRGWIAIPDTVISYPIVQGTDNSYYLNHT